MDAKGALMHIDVFICMSIGTYMCVYTYVYTHMYTPTPNTHIHTRIRISMNTHRHTHMYIHVHTQMRFYVWECVWGCVWMCVCVCVRVCAFVFCKHTCINFIHTYVWRWNLHTFLGAQPPFQEAYAKTHQQLLSQTQEKDGFDTFLSGSTCITILVGIYI